MQMALLDNTGGSGSCEKFNIEGDSIEDILKGYERYLFFLYVMPDCRQ
jgi:hypothetical protein